MFRIEILYPKSCINEYYKLVSRLFDKGFIYEVVESGPSFLVGSFDPKTGYFITNISKVSSEAKKEIYEWANKKKSKGVFINEGIVNKPVRKRDSIFH